MKILNLFLGFAFVIFGYSALNMIPDLGMFIGREMLAWFLYFSISFCLTFIAWALSYVYLKGQRNPTLEDAKRRLKEERKIATRNEYQMELKI
jgi:hypothetical protein